jgi:hypothetical protein
VSREIPVELLRELIDYDPQTGALTWRARDVSHFEATENKTAEAQCKWWNGRFAGVEAFTASNSSGGRHGRIFGQLYHAHRVCWALQHGAWPEHEVDHINGNRADNRLRNLRAVTHQVNMQNKRRYASNKSGRPGVHYHKGKGRWCAFITIDKQRRHLGAYGSFDEAAAVRQQAERGIFHPNHGRAA